MALARSLPPSPRDYSSLTLCAILFSLSLVSHNHLDGLKLIWTLKEPLCLCDNIWRNGMRQVECPSVLRTRAPRDYQTHMHSALTPHHPIQRLFHSISQKRQAAFPLTVASLLVVLCNVMMLVVTMLLSFYSSPTKYPQSESFICSHLLSSWFQICLKRAKVLLVPQLREIIPKVWYG